VSAEGARGAHHPSSSRGPSAPAASTRGSRWARATRAGLDLPEDLVRLATDASLYSTSTRWKRPRSSASNAGSRDERAAVAMDRHHAPRGWHHLRPRRLVGLRAARFDPRVALVSLNFQIRRPCARAPARLDPVHGVPRVPEVLRATSSTDTQGFGACISMARSACVFMRTRSRCPADRDYKREESRNAATRPGTSVVPADSLAAT
jgi:hypothetical protein